MAKFLKSFFHTGEKKPAKIELDDDKDFTPPLDDRRKLSISRSGRMKQNNKRRLKLNPELYGENYQADRCQPKEYHVHGKLYNTNATHNNNNNVEKHEKTSRKENVNTAVTAEEEIESAFRVIDKVQ